VTRQGPEVVADDLWARVRELSRKAEVLGAAERLSELDVDGQAQLDRLRVRLGRAVERAQLADRLADQLYGIDRDRQRSDSP